MKQYFIFLIIIRNVYIFAPQNTATNHLHFVLGCQAVIPCGHKRSDSNSFKWFYKRNEHSAEMQIFFEDKGLRFYAPGHLISPDRSLVIHHFTEDHHGLYWCVNCYEDSCSSERSTVMRVTTEILSETQQTVYVTAGSTFLHPCPGESTNFKWTFTASQAVRNPKVRTEADFVSLNKSIHVANVRRADAGKYTCWTSCNGHTHKLLTVNLCVITVHQNGNASVLCAVICDAEFKDIKHNNMSMEETDLRKISVHVKPYGLLNCSAKQRFDAYGTVNSTHAPSNASSETAGTDAQPDYLTPVIYGTPVALIVLILIALLIFYIRPRLRADISDNHNSACDINGKMEDELTVVYSSVIISAKTTATRNNYIDCVYSELQF